MIEIKQEHKGHLRIKCSSNYKYLDDIVDKSDAFLGGLLKDDDLVYKVVLLLSEAVTNAIEHGNAQDESKHVFVEILVKEKRIEVLVEDEGEGFERTKLSSPTESDNLLKDGGRGIFFIESMADEVHFEKDGSKVLIVFHVT